MIRIFKEFDAASWPYSFFHASATVSSSHRRANSRSDCLAVWVDPQADQQLRIDRQLPSRRTGPNPNATPAPRSSAPGGLRQSLRPPLASSAEAGSPDESKVVLFFNSLAHAPLPVTFKRGFLKAFFTAPNWGSSHDARPALRD